jgi:hypothetical protein
VGASTAAWDGRGGTVQFKHRHLMVVVQKYRSQCPNENKCGEALV